MNLSCPQPFAIDSKRRLAETSPTLMTESYVVEAILDTKVNEQGEPVHLVKWRGYPDSHNSWEPTSSFSTSGAAKKYDQ